MTVFTNPVTPPVLALFILFLGQGIEGRLEVVARFKIDGEVEFSLAAINWFIVASVVALPADAGLVADDDIRPHRGCTMAGFARGFLLHLAVLDVFAPRTVTGLAADTEFLEFIGLGVKPRGVAPIAFDGHGGLFPVLHLVGNPFLGADHPFGGEGVIFPSIMRTYTCSHLLPTTYSISSFLKVTRGFFWEKSPII